MARSILSLALFIGGIVVSGTYTFGEEAVVSVEVDPTIIIREDFMGFGVEWDSRGYNAAGITDQDFELIRRRVDWMGLPVARIMMQSKWCYKGNDRYDWDDPQMKALYRHLDFCQERGITVLLTDWGIEPGWLNLPDVSKVEELKYAEIIATHMDHLLNTKRYTCIKYFILVNEPNYEVRDYGRWKSAVTNVSAAFRKRGLDRKITFMGSDTSGKDDWHRNAVDQLQTVFGAYDIHCYASEDMARTGRVFDFVRTCWAYALANDPQAAGKPLIVAEAGFWVPGSSASANPLHLDPRYGILMADYAVQAANAGSWAVLAWMLDDNSHPEFSWGMWKSKAEGLAVKPWFYTWALLVRSFQPGCAIVKAEVDSKDVRVLAARLDEKTSSGKESWAFCVVNRADAPRTVRLHVKGGPRLNLNRYVYGAASARADNDGFPIALDNRTYDLGEGVEIPCEPNSVLILSPTGSETNSQ